MAASTWLKWIQGIGSALNTFTGSNTAKFAGNMYANSVNAGLNRTAAQNMAEKIEMGRQYGIHPLEAIGGNTSAGATIPMQNPFGGTQTVKSDPNERLNTRIKEESLKSLLREAQDAKWKYSIVIPVTHPELPGETLWGFNPKYQMFGTTAQAIVLASNRKTALKMLMKGFPPRS